MPQRESPDWGEHQAKMSIGRHRRKKGSLSSPSYKEGSSPDLYLPEGCISVSLHMLAEKEGCRSSALPL